MGSHTLDSESWFILSPEDDDKFFHRVPPGHGRRYAILFRRLGLYSTFETSPPYRMVAVWNTKPIVPKWHVRMDRCGKLKELRKNTAKGAVQISCCEADCF